MIQLMVLEGGLALKLKKNIIIAIIKIYEYILSIEDGLWYFKTSN